MEDDNRNYISRLPDLPRYVSKGESSDLQTRLLNDKSKEKSQDFKELNIAGLEERQCCEKLYTKIFNELSERDQFTPNSREYDSLSGTIRVHLRQLETELNHLDNHLKTTFNLTYEEKERRQRIVEELRAKQDNLMRLFNNSLDYVNKPSSRSRAFDDDDELLGREMTAEELKRKHQSMLSEQDEGLERLSNIISRQKNIAITIGTEVDTQNDMIDDIGTRVESVNTRVHSESRDVTGLLNTETTYGYWMVIILLFIIIIGVSIG